MTIAVLGGRKVPVSFAWLDPAEALCSEMVAGCEDELLGEGITFGEMMSVG
jgi:hypothetical protein